MFTENISMNFIEKQNQFIGAFVTLIKEARNAKNLSIRELGAMAKVSYTVIYDLENKNILPKFETINKLAMALDLTIDIKKFRVHKYNVKGMGIIYYPECYSKSFVQKSLYNTDMPSLNIQLEDILAEKGLHSKDIEEVKNFIEFKLSQHNK